MKKLTPWLVVGVVLAGFTAAALAGTTLPNYASGGNLEGELQSKGKAITDVVSLVVAILAIIGILVGAGKISFGDPDNGKRWVGGGVVGLIIAGSVFGIAALVAR